MVAVEVLGGVEGYVRAIDVVPAVAEALGGGEVVAVGVAAGTGADVFTVAGEGEIGVAEVSGLCSVVGGEFNEDAAALQRLEVDAYGCPVFP